MLEWQWKCITVFMSHTETILFDLISWYHRLLWYIPMQLSTLHILYCCKHICSTNFKKSCTRCPFNTQLQSSLENSENLALFLPRRRKLLKVFAQNVCLNYHFQDSSSISVNPRSLSSSLKAFLQQWFRFTFNMTWNISCTDRGLDGCCVKLKKNTCKSINVQKQNWVHVNKHGNEIKQCKTLK